jgi:hypothetical protein
MSIHPKTEYARDVISNELAKLEKLFLPHCRLTFIMRNPEEEDGDMVITNDKLADLRDVLDKMMTKESS